MSTSAVDSLQNALVDNISGVYLRTVPLLWVRALVLVLTVPCLVVSLKVRCATPTGPPASRQPGCQPRGARALPVSLWCRGVKHKLSATCLNYVTIHGQKHGGGACPR